MDFNLTEEQAILKDTTRRFFQKECPADFVREMIEDEKGYSPELWKKMAELGWMGLLFKEDYGGSGASFMDVAVILEEMGRCLLPSPFFSTVILGGLTIVEGGDEYLQKRFLEKIAAGNLIMTLALHEVEGSYSLGDVQTRGEQGKGGFILNGKKMFVPDAFVADYMICPAKDYPGTDGLSLFIVERKSKGVGITPLQGIHLQKQYEVSISDVFIPKENMIGERGQGSVYLQGVWPKAVSGKCCEMLGAMQRVIEMTVNYVQERSQFDQPLSAFQIIQHYCADMAIALECSKFITYQTCWKVSNELSATKEASMAKGWCSNALKKIATIAHQVHGSIGFTREHDLYLFSRCAKAWELAFGDANFHKESVAKEMNL